MQLQELYPYIQKPQPNICQISVLQKGNEIYSAEWNGYQRTDCVHIATASPKEKRSVWKSFKTMSGSFSAWFIVVVYGEVKNVNELDEKWILCPVCGAKTRLRLLQRTLLRDFPLFCPKCKQERIINAQNFRIEIIHQPDAKTQC